MEFALLQSPNGPFWLIGVLFSFGLGFIVAFYVYRRLQQRAGSLNQRQGRRAEKRAVRLLENEGFKVLDVHPRITCRLWVNGDAGEFAITPDMLVEKDRIRYVVEVKRYNDHSGIANAAVRRQVLEYLFAGGMPCLLVRMPEGEIDLIEIPPDRNRPAGPERPSGLSGKPCP